MAINNLLFSVQNMSPVMLSVGVGKTQNYNNLADLTNSLWGNDSTSNTNPLLGNNSGLGDTVTFTYKKIADQVVSDMAAVTADAIKKFPELDDEYVIAIIDDGTNREARVYKRSDILDNFEGTDKEKAELEKQLTNNPLMVFSSANGLSDTYDDEASKYLASGLNDFLKTNAKIFNTLDKAGFDPLSDLLGSSTLKKILANCAHPLGTDEEKAEAEESAEA